MKPLHLALLALAALPPVAALAVQSRPAAPTRVVSPIAYISVQKVLTESAPAKAAASRLEETRKSRTDEVNAKKKALDDTRLALANAGGIFSGSRRAELQRIAQRQETELKQATEDAQKAMVDLQRQVQTELRAELGRVINEVAREQPIQFVLNADTSLVWARNATDLTGEVLGLLNATPAAPAPAK